jgi:hypothetical protein
VDVKNKKEWFCAIKNWVEKANESGLKRRFGACLSDLLLMKKSVIA